MYNNPHMKYLKFDHASDTNSSGAKFVLDCKEITEEHPTTQGWLEHVKLLEIIDKNKAGNMSNKKILQGILNKHSKVVIKVADTQNDLKIEWDTYKKLKEHLIPGIVKYYCYFTCNDELRKYNEINKEVYLCQGPGTQIQVLVMEYVQSSSFKNFDWHKLPKEDLTCVFQSCIKQVFYTMIEAFVSCHYTHGDLHLDNILIQPTTKKSIKYKTIGIDLPIYKYQIKLLDFENSSFEKNTLFDHYQDIRTFTNKLRYIDDYEITDVFNTIHKTLVKKIEDMETLKQTKIPFKPSDLKQNYIFELIKLVDKIECKQNISVHTHIGGNKKRYPCIHKFWTTNRTPNV